MLHIGTNDCANKTSDEVLNEITKLAQHIEIVLSLPTMRTDSNRANVIIRNLKIYPLIKVPTCFKHPMNPSCIDVVLSNRARSFQNSAS